MLNCHQTSNTVRLIGILPCNSFRILKSCYCHKQDRPTVNERLICMGKLYAGYLKSEHWKGFKVKALDYYEHKCQKCGSSRRLNVHHLNYYRLQHELMEDVTVLCWYCHNKEHHSDCMHVNKKPCIVMKGIERIPSYYCHDCRCIIE